MQPVSNSTIVLYSHSRKNEWLVKSVSFGVNRFCEISGRTFEELFLQRTLAQLPCVIVKVKDVMGTVHLFDGCSATALGCFNKPGYFKVLNDPALKACSSIQYYEIVRSDSNGYQACYSFELRDEHYYDHSESSQDSGSESESSHTDIVPETLAEELAKALDDLHVAKEAKKNEPVVAEVFEKEQPSSAEAIAKPRRICSDCTIA